MENQDKDANSLAYNRPIHESSSSKISSPSGGEKRSSRDNTKVTSAIFNQTLDHHHHLEEFSKQGARSVDQRSPDPDHHLHSTTTALAIASTSASYPGATTTGTSLIHYKECLRNHAANIGGHVLDGCGEFMPGGEEGTPEALKCAACDCHRNFHRKEINHNINNGLLSQQQPSTVANNCYVYSNNNNKSSQRNRVVSYHHHHHHQPQYPSLLPPPTTHQPPQQQQQYRLTHFMSTTTSPQRAPMMVTFGGGGGGGDPAEYSSSEDLNNHMYQSNAEIMQGREKFEFGMSSKKRFRTKFSQEQKDKMHEFAEKLGWKMQKQDDDEVQQFCSQVGVKRQVFKVWMHNNKQAMKKKQL